MACLHGCSVGKYQIKVESFTTNSIRLGGEPADSPDDGPEHAVPIVPPAGNEQEPIKLAREKLNALREELEKDNAEYGRQIPECEEDGCVCEESSPEQVLHGPSAPKMREKRVEFQLPTGAWWRGRWKFTRQYVVVKGVCEPDDSKNKVSYTPFPDENDQKLA